MKWAIHGPKNNKGPEGRLTQEASRGPQRGDSSNTGPGTDSRRAKQRVQDTSAIKNGSCDMVWPDDKSMNTMDGNLYIRGSFKDSQYISYL